MDALASTPKDQGSSLMRRPSMAILAALILVAAIVLVVVATHRSSPQQQVVVYDQKGHVVSGQLELTYVYATNGKVVAARCTHANGQVEHAITPGEIHSLIRSCR